MNKKTIYYVIALSTFVLLFLAFIAYQMMGALNLPAIEARGDQLKAYFYNVIFWLFVFACGAFSVFLFTRKKLFLKFVPVVALLWNFFYFSQERHLLSEDITGSFTNLFGFSNNYRDLFIFYAWFFDYAAWLTVILGLAYLWTGVTKRLGKLDLLVMPPIFTLLSFVYNRPCGGWICIMSGNGFPLPYYEETFNWWVFLIDVAVWALIIYPSIKLFIKKGFTRRTANNAKEVSGESIKPSKLNRMADSKKLLLILAGFFGIETTFGTIRMIALNDFTSFRIFNASDTFIPWIAFLAEFILSIMGIITALSLFRRKGNYLALAAALILGIFFLIMLYDVAIYLPLMIGFLLFPQSG